MLTKKEMIGCLAGEPTPVAPAYFFWMDSDFIDQHPDFVAQMRAKYADDMLQIMPQLISRAAPIPLMPGEFVDEWGCRFCHAPTGVGAHPTLPIVHDLNEWEAYVKHEMPLIVEGAFAAQAAKAVGEYPDRYVLLNVWRTFYERMYMLIGMQELWINLAEESDLFCAMLEDLKRFTLSCIRQAKKAGVDGVYLADDWGMQDRLQISPNHWVRYFKPAYAEMIQLAHSLGMQVWLHSCGCIDSIVPELIDIGLDVIGNLQYAAVNLPELSRMYRGRITFFGGLDVQTNLTKGTPSSVRAEVRALAKMFKPRDGRFIFAPSNTIMPESPTQNVAAMFEAIDEYRRS